MRIIFCGLLLASVALVGCGANLLSGLGGSFVCDAYDSNGDGHVTVEETRAGLVSVFGESVVSQMSDADIQEALNLYGCN